jgi:opacity protein-like surface antigen
MDAFRPEHGSDGPYGRPRALWLLCRYFLIESTPSWRFGWVAGLGVEARVFDTNWLARLEYLHYDFGNSGSSSNPAFLLPGRRELAIRPGRRRARNLLGSGRARLGYLVWPNVLLYGTGGLAWTRLEQTMTTLNSDGTTVTTTPSWRFGWVAGAGGETRLWNTNWLAGLEYLHYDFGGSATSMTGFTDPTGIEFLITAGTARHLTADVVRTGLGYKFD